MPASIARHARARRFSLFVLVSPLSVARKVLRSRICSRWGRISPIKGSAFYHFSVNPFDSADGTRHYRVWTAVPNKAAPASGYPILYMLDGNAVMDRLNDELLKQLAEKSPPVIVAVGYQTNLPFDLNGRGLRLYAGSRKRQNLIPATGVLAVRVVAATTSASYWKRALRQKWNRD